MNGIIGRVDDKGALLNQQCIACLYALGADSGVAVSSRSVVKIIGIKDKFRIVRFIFRRALFAFSRLTAFQEGFDRLQSQVYYRRVDQTRLLYFRCGLHRLPHRLRW